MNRFESDFWGKTQTSWDEHRQRHTKCTSFTKRQRRFLLTIYVALLPRELVAEQAGFRTRHITTVAITAVCRNEIHSANQYNVYNISYNLYNVYNISYNLYNVYNISYNLYNVYNISYNLYNTYNISYNLCTKRRSMGGRPLDVQK